MNIKDKIKQINKLMLLQDLFVTSLAMLILTIIFELVFDNIMESWLPMRFWFYLTLWLGFLSYLLKKSHEKSSNDN